MKNELEARQQIKARKPKFRRQDAHKHIKLKSGWRKPKGLHSKMRVSCRSYRYPVAAGWGSPLAVRGLTRTGLRPVMIATPAALEKLDASKDAAVIVASVGARKRELIIKRAQELKIRIENARDPTKALATLVAARAAVRTARDEKKKVAAKKKEKKSIDERVAETKKAKAGRSAEEKKDAAEIDADAAEEKADELEAEKQRVLTKKM